MNFEYNLQGAVLIPRWIVKYIIIIIIIEIKENCNFQKWQVANIYIRSTEEGEAGVKRDKNSNIYPANGVTGFDLLMVLLVSSSNITGVKIVLRGLSKQQTSLYLVLVARKKTPQILKYFDFNSFLPLVYAIFVTNQEQET